MTDCSTQQHRVGGIYPLKKEERLEQLSKQEVPVEERRSQRGKQVPAAELRRLGYRGNLCRISGESKTYGEIVCRI